MYKTYDYERLTINNYNVPVSQVERAMLNEEQVKRIDYFSTYKQFENYICGRTQTNENQKERGQD